MALLTISKFVAIGIFVVLLCGLPIQGETENLETECRPYVEKALKEQLEHVEPSLSGSTESQEATEGTEAPDDGSASTEAEQQPDSSETAEDVREDAEETQEIVADASGETDESKTAEETDASAEKSGEDNEAQPGEEKSAESEEKAEEETQSTESSEQTDETNSDQGDGEQASTEEQEKSEQESTEEVTQEGEAQPDTSTEEAPAEEEVATEEEEVATEEEAVPEESSEDKTSTEEEPTESEDKSTEDKSGEDSAASIEEQADATIEGSEETKEDSVSDEQTVEEGSQEDKSGEQEGSQEDKSGEQQASVEEATDKPDESGETPAEEASTEDAKSGEETQENVSQESESVEKADESKEKSKEESKEESKEDTKEDSKEESKEDSKEELSTEPAAAEVESKETAEEASKEAEASESADEVSQEAADELAGEEATEIPAEIPETDEDELTKEFVIPEVQRPRDQLSEILHLDDESSGSELALAKAADSTLRELKRLYDTAIKPLEILYKYRDLSNRHFGDPEIFSKPLILFMGPWSGGKSSIINYLLDNEYNENSLRTGAEPSPAYFNIVTWGAEPEILDGTQLAADWTFSGLQKFGQGLEDRLRGLKLPNKLLEMVNIVEIPGILEVRKQVSRYFPFNDACQWFIDRADVIFLVYDPSKLDVGPETEAILDQLKGREYQTRVILNKADTVKPEELLRVQGALLWNISPLMSSPQPPIIYTTSLWSTPYNPGSPVKLLQSQERAFLRDIRQAVDRRVENKIASARRFAVRVRNHAKMVDCYLTTYYNHKTFFGNRKSTADDIIENPQSYHIYEGLSTLKNISRYDLPDPETYKDFFKINPLYDFQQLAATCTYFKGCPINRLDVCIAYDLPELVGKHKKLVEQSVGSKTPLNS